MMIVNGMERNVFTAADFEMETTQADRVLLPYRGELWGDLLHHTLNAVLPSFGDGCERGLLYDEAIRETDVSVLFNVQRRQVRATAYITAHTTRMERVDTRLPIMTSSGEVMSVLDEFFRKGGSGLAPDYLLYYRKKYEEWRCGAV